MKDIERNQGVESESAVLVGVFLLLGGIVFGAMSAAPDLAAPPSPLPGASDHAFKFFGKNLEVDPRIILLAVVVAAVWIDLSNWMLARFWLLPKVEP